MKESYSSFVGKDSNLNIPVGQPIKGKDMVVNNTGGFVFKTGNWKQLDRFLILGVCSSTYYASRKDLVLDNIGAIEECIKENGPQVVNRVVEISSAGRAPKNDPALFVLALCLTKGNDATKAAVVNNLSKVARIGTHILHFTNYVNDLRGFGRAVKRAIGNWFNDKDGLALSKQVVKYRQRDGWSMRDALRVSHPVPKDQAHKDIYHWITKGWDSVGVIPHPDKNLQAIWAFERAKSVTSEKEIAKLVRNYELPWEALDTKWLKSCEVWDALIESIKPEALMRNLGRLTEIGYIAPLSNGTRKVIDILSDVDAIRASRLHPLKILNALKVYSSGHGDKGSLHWTPNQNVSSVLDSAFYTAFGNVEPTGKNILLGLDISGSMTCGNIAGTTITPREATAALALIQAKVEKNSYIVGFSHDIMELNINSKQSLDAVTRYMYNLPFGSTNPSALTEWALKKKIHADCFVVMTDNEVNTGLQPSLSLDKYRQKTGIDAKMVVAGMTATNFTIADPDKDYMLDVVGFDTSSPQLISDFISGKI